MTALTAYTPIRIGRSDGELTIKTPKHGREPNCPSSDQQDSAANPDDYYEELAPSHPIALEWKRQLGRMLQIEHDGASKKSSEMGKWFLVFFPENYRLYRHVTTAEKVKAGKKAEKSSKGGAGSGGGDGGGEDGAGGEAYLYGYPLGRKKRYRTAKEFFPHLMWLAEDKSYEYGDCTCKHCAPDWVQKVEPLPGREGFLPAGVSAGMSLGKKENASVKVAVRKETGAVKKEPAQVKRDTSAPKQVPKVVIPARPISQESTTKPPIKAPTTTTTRPAVSLAPTPTPLPPARNAEQAEDAIYHRFLYRPGEVTWFNRGSAWGLSVILSRSLYTSATGHPNRPRYIVQPLSHPFAHPPVKQLDTEEDLRPWLAWSAPGATHSTLTSPPGNYTYNNIPWREVAEGRFGPGDAEVDGSIFAAKMIDDSFTLLEPLRNDTSFITTGERSYNAIYLGGEKIWIGEPVRLRVGGGQDVMVLHSIVEKLKPGSTDAMKATVWVVGDVLRWVSMPAAQETATAPGGGLPSQGHLPVRMREDLEFRNRITRAKKGVVGYWKLLSPLQRINICEVKGRWYESSLLLPVLRGAETYAGDVARGEISDVGSWINGREDANMAGGRVGTRKAERIEALGRAVPEGTRIGLVPDSRRHEGSGPPASAVSSSMVAASATGGSGVGMGIGEEGKQVTGVSDGDIGEFMDLDKMEDGFARDFVDGGGRV